MKTLYFEGAGIFEADSSKDTIGNCRIRTAFTNNEGQQIYLEMSAAARYKGNQLLGYKLYINFCYYITGKKDDCNNSKIKYDYENTINNYNYSIEDITRWINYNL